MQRGIVFILGTRPEVIKLAPVLSALRKVSSGKVTILSSGQHAELTKQAFKVFDIHPDIDLALMQANQSPNSFLGLLLPHLDRLLREHAPAGVLVQGDTSTALGGALAAFEIGIPVAHVEAGLRTHDLKNPFPEEMNRVVIARMAQLHFCPTEGAAENLRHEGIEKNIFVVGNTVVDAALSMARRIREGLVQPNKQILERISRAKKLLLVTSHRRDNFGKPLTDLCEALLQITRENPELEVLFPVHLNPNVGQVVRAVLSNQERVHLVDPIDYPTLIAVLERCQLIISDSGGIQEEAPSFGVPVIVVRQSSERPEGLRAGTSHLRSLHDVPALIDCAKRLIASPVPHGIPNPFGDGQAAERIAQIVKQNWLHGGAD